MQKINKKKKNQKKECAYILLLLPDCYCIQSVYAPRGPYSLNKHVYVNSQSVIHDR